MSHPGSGRENNKTPKNQKHINIEMAALPAGPDSNMRADTVGRSEAYLTNFLHFK